MGGNLSCTSGMRCTSGKKSKRKKKKLGEQLEEKRRLVDELRTKSSELIPRLSQHDREFLDQSIRTVERRCSELQASVEKHCRSYGVLGEDLGDIRDEANQYLQWLDSQSSILASETGLGFANSNTEVRLKAAKELKRELDEKQMVLQIVRQKADAVLQDLPGPERASVEHLVAQAQARHEQVCEQVSNECVRLEAAQVQHVEFQRQVDKEKEWLNTHAKMADKLDAVRLLASDVEKQADESKILAVKVQNRISRLDQLEVSGQMLKEQCIDDSAAEIGEILAELREQHGGLVARLKQQEDHLRSCSAVRHVYETDYQKIEHWCNETDIKCMGDLPLDCATEVLEVQCRQYEQELASTAHGFESLLKETMERGENFKRHLHDADLPILENQMASLQNRFSSTVEVIRERTDSLERTISSRHVLQTSVESTTRWLDDMQAQIQAASVAPGYSVPEAEQALHRFKDLEKMIADYQQVMTELSSYVEPLRAEGQVSQAEAILRLTSQYEFLMDTLVSSHKRSQAALAIRQQHQKQLSELYTSLEDTRKEMARVLASDLSIPQRLQIYKELEHRLISLQPQVGVSEDHAQQIAADCLQADRAGVLSQVETVKEQLSDLCSALSAHIEHCQQLQLEQEGFEAAMNETISWLEDKEDILASLRPLHLDSDKVDPVMEKHKIMSREAEMRISDIKAKAAGELTRYQELEEPVPNVMCEKLQQIEALEQSIQEAVQKKEQYLLEAKTDRQQLETLMHQVGDWLRGAEELLDSGYDGLDYSLIDQTLTEFSDYFSEASLCQDEMDQVSELSDKLLTSLDSNDTQTLQQSRSSVSKRFSRILASSQQKVEHLESKSAQWHDFQEKMQVMSTVLDELETQWQEVDISVLTSAQNIETHLQPLKTFNAKLEGERPTIGALNETARSLIRTANVDSAGIINRVISSLNQRWDTLVSQAENKLSSFEELHGQWVEFSASLHGAADVLNSVQDTLNMATVLTDSNADLVEKVDLLRVSKDDLDTIGPQMERLRASSTDLQKALPSAEAKVALEERFIVLQENYTRLKSCVQENLSRVQEELDDRENFQKEMSQLQSWLTDTESDLQRMDPESEDTGCNLEKIKLYQHELKVRMEQVQRQQATQQTRYEAEGRELPQEMSQQLQEVLALEKVVSVALRQKEEELVHIHQDREEYQASLATVTSWLQQASQQVQERIVSIPQARTRHQELLSQFDEFKHSLDKLRTKGSDIIQHTTDQGEKHSVQKTIAVINRQWLSLQAQTADRTHELTEAADLAHAVDDVASSVQTWLMQAETALSSHLDWSDSNSVKEQLKCHRHLAKELEQNEDRVIALNAMVKQLGQVCDTSTSMAAITALRQRVQQVSGDSATRLGLLEDANKKFEDYEREISDLTRWMEETRIHLSKRDTTHDLKEQLALHEHLLEDIRSNKARTEVVLQQHAPLGDLRGQAPLSQGDRLLREIGQLEEAAQEQCGQLQVAVTEQEEYESELRHLHAAISEAQQQLLASPVQASSVEALKQQIAERNEGIMQSAVPRKRSASLGQRTEPLGLLLGDSSAVAQLNVSWNSLQKQVAAKERELQVTLQKQEKYQQAVQELNARMERVQIRLAQTPASSAADVNTQMKEYREALSELEGLKEDIARVQERGRQIMETSDAESQKAMGATVSMLSDRLSNLQTVADHRGKQLQDAMKHRNKHDIALSAYKKRVSDLEKWLTEMKIAHASSGLPTDEPSALQQQLLDNRDLQDEINSRLQQISDLAVQCDSLCELEQPAQADVLRNSLASLQSSLGNFKFASIEKETALRSAIREAEKRRREMEDYEKNVQKLQQWMMDTKQMTLASEQSPPVTFPDHQQLRQELASDLSQHRQLVRQLSISTPSQKAFEKLQSSASEERKPAPPSVTEEELHVRWEKLQRELAQKTGELESVLQRRKSGDGITPVRPSIADTSVQLDEVQALMLQLTQCWQQLQVQVADKQQRLDTVLSFQQQMQSAFTAISTWLDLAEQMVLSSSTEDQPEHEQIRRNEALQRELRSLHSEISTLSNQAQSLLGTSVESHSLIQQSLTSLTQRVGMLESQAASHSTQLHQSQLQWQQYHEDVRLLRSHMQELQTSAIMPTAGSAATLDSLVSDVHKIESQLKKCENRLSELKARERELSVGRPKGAVLSELSTLHNSFMELQRKVAERKASLLQSVSVQEQYEKMLKDYAYFLETAEGKLRTESISARDLPHLKQQLSAHKEFFSDLEVHKAMLDSLAAQCDVTTQEGHSMQHTRLSNLTHVLADQASLHGQRLDRAVRQWVELDSKLEHLQHFLDQVQEGIPKPVASGDSLATIQEKLVKFKRLQGQLGDEKPAVFQAVDKGKQILHSVACPALETTLTELADKWVELNTQLVQELKKTETIGEQLQIFEAEAMVLKTWMSTAKMKLESLKYLTEEDMQNIGNIRTRVEHVLEFRKEVQNQLPLKNKVLSVGRQLMANSSYDTRGLDARLEGIEEEWSQLEQAIDTAAQSLHQAQMELMPSRQALHELQLWMEEMEKALAADANTTIRTIADIDVMLKKYKGHKVDLVSKQLTVDFVNQAVLQPGPQEKDVPHEKLEFAEKLAEVNHHWQQVSSAINERLRSLEGLAGLWSDYERAVGQLHTWFRQQEDKLKRYRLIGHEVGVKQTLKDCKAMQEQLQARKEDMEHVKKLGQRLIDQSKESAGCQRSVRDSLSSVWQQWEQLQQQTMQLESLLTDMLGQWARYHADLHSLSQVLAQIEYTLNRYSLVGADIRALGNQVDKLKNLEAELKQHSGHLDSFTTLATQLCQVCEPPVQAEVQGTVLDLKARCSRLSADLSTRRAEFELCLVKWKEYEQQCRRVCEWLEQKEQEANQLLTMREDVASRQDCLKKSEALEQELDGVQSQLSSLYRLSDELTKNMGTSTIVLLTSQQSGMEQRLLTLRQLLSQQIQALREDLSQGKRFREAFSTVVAFLEHAQQVLSSEDPSKSAEHSALQKRLDQLKQLLAQFQTKAGKLDEVNDLGYRLALDASDASQLIELNHTWHRLLADCQDRCKALQGHLLTQQDFTAKCETWMTFLASVEHDLSSEIAGNLRDLLEQQKKCQKFESDMYSNQQVLHAIISDGQKMMRAGEVEDPQEFEQKLRLLSEQWQSVIRRANQRKNIINTIIQNWHMFNSLAEQLRKWLAEKESTLKTFQFDMVSLQQVRSLLDKVRTAQKEFSLQEESFRKVHDLGGMLLHQADLSASQDIKQCTAQLQNDWLQVYSRLEEHSQRLEAVQRDWLECETDIEDILVWLKNIRSMLATDIPHAYDDLQSDLTKCKDITVSFANSEDKRQALLAREKNLSRFLQAEDMNVLHQRIRLLNKQWDELVSQAGLREQRLLDSTFHWSSLGQQIRALIHWIDQMEMNIASSREIHVEDLLSKLENEYQEAIREKGLEKEELLAKGRHLMNNSSEIRASDIEQRLQNLANKWQHLLGIVDLRRKKLHETVLAVRQLDSTMRSLSQWLASMEQELHAPVVFLDCDLHEIQRQLERTQNFQREVEHHSAGVSSVLNLCEVLLHDSDACPTQKEFDALHHAMKNLDRRWKDICSLCPKRRAWIEETWHMWEDFQTDCKRFSLWLGEMELEAGDPEIVAPGGSVSKEEIRRYEALQTKVLDRLDNLESTNKQYRRLVKEGRTDTSGVLKAAMQEVNDRWDSLQLHVRAIMQGMRQSASVREDFMTTYASLFKWLTEVEIQLTNIEHLSQLDVHTKLKELKRIEEEVDDRRHRMDYLNQAAALLIQQGTGEEAQKIQEDLNEFKIFSRNVLEHIATCYLKLQRIALAQEQPLRSSELTKEVVVGSKQGTFTWDSQQLEEYLESSPPRSPPHKRRAGVETVQVPKASVPPIRRSYSPTRRSASPSHQQKQSPSHRGQDVTDSGERWQAARRERNAKIEVLMEQLIDALKDASAQLDTAEQQLQNYNPSLTDSAVSLNQLQSLVACEGLIDTIQRLDRLLKIEAGTNIPSADFQISEVLERWERLQSFASQRDLRLSQQQHELAKFHADVEGLLAWMEEAEALQASHSHIPSDILDLNDVIRQHKDFMVQLESKKAHMLSIRLLSKNYVNAQTSEGRQLLSRLQELDQRWEALTGAAARTQQSLQEALLQCQEFHHTVHNYLMWLESVEDRLRCCEPVSLSADHSSLWGKHRILKDLHRELADNQAKVLMLRETAEQLLGIGESPELAAARDKTRIIANRLRSLLTLTTSYIESLETKLGVKSSSVDSREARQLSSVYPTVRTRNRSPFAVLRRLLFGVPPISVPASDSENVNLTTKSDPVTGPYQAARIGRRSLLYRVLRAALPLQVLLFLLVGMACLLPVCEDDDYGCLLSNNMLASLTPMLRYTEGAPPT